MGFAGCSGIPHLTPPLSAPRGGEGDHCAVNRARFVLAAGNWPRDHEVGTVTLGWDDRHRRRLVMALDAGGEILLDLGTAARLGDGDGLLLDDGGIVRVVAAPEPVLEIRGGASSLARLAYHLGNRHLPVQILPDALVIRRDHVIEEMLRGLGAELVAAELPFTPEPGAYGGGHGHVHDHVHDHDH